MSLVFMDGFDHYETADILKKWSTTTVWTPTFGTILPGVSPAWSRAPGGQALRLNGSAQTLTKNLSTTIVTGVVGFNLMLNTIGAATIFIFMDGGTEQCSLRMNASGQITFNRGTTVLATSSNNIVAATWYHIEIKATINNTTGTYEVRVNGSSSGWIAPATGANTRNGTNNYFSQVQLISNVVETFDDFYVLNCAISPNNDFLGPQKIFVLLPEKNGTYNQFTPNYMDNFENVRETTGDADNTFNQSSTVNNIDSFNLTNVPTATINAIQHVILARQDAGAQRAIASFQRQGTTDVAGSTNMNLAGSYLYYLDPKDTNPADSNSAWTASGINNSEFGYKLVQ